MLIRHALYVPPTSAPGRDVLLGRMCGLFSALGARSAIFHEDGLGVILADGSTESYQPGQLLVFNRHGAFRCEETPMSSLDTNDRIMGIATGDFESDIWDAIFTLAYPPQKIADGYRVVPLSAEPENCLLATMYIPAGSPAYKLTDRPRQRESFLAGMEAK